MQVGVVKKTRKAYLLTVFLSFFEIAGGVTLGGSLPQKVEDVSPFGYLRWTIRKTDSNPYPPGPSKITKEQAPTLSSSY